MSQLATLRPLSRPSLARRQNTPAPLRVVTADGSKGQYGFVALCLLLLVAGLLGGLLLNTSMAKGSFVLGDLQHRSSELADTEDALNHAIDAQSAPAMLADQALKLGMVPAQSPAFLRLDDGKVLGVAEPAKADGGFTVVAQGSVAPTSSAGKAKAAPTTAVGPKTTVKTSGSVTTTTVTVVKAKVIEQTITSVDTSTGRTTSTTISTPRKATTTSTKPAKPAAAAKPATKPSVAPKP